MVIVVLEQKNILLELILGSVRSQLIVWVTQQIFCLCFVSVAVDPLHSVMYCMATRQHKALWTGIVVLGYRGKYLLL